MAWRNATKLLITVSLFLFALLVLSEMPGYADDTLVRVGIYQNEPKVFINEKGKADGFFVEILNHIAAKEKWQIEYVFGTWPQCRQRLENGEIDLLMDIAFTEERDEIYDYNREVVLSNWALIYLQDGSDIQSIFDLEDKKIAALKGDVSYREFTDILERFGINVDFVETDDFLSVLKRIDSKQADAGIISRLFGRKHEKEFDVQRSNIVCCPTDLHYATAEGKNPHLLKAIDWHLSSLIEDKNSLYYKSMARWIGGDEIRRPAWVPYVVLSILGFAVWMFITSMVLRRQVRRKTMELSHRNVELKEEITNRQRAEESLQESERKFRTIFEGAQVALFRIRIGDGKVLEANRNMAEVFGYDNAEDFVKDFYMQPNWVDQSERERMHRMFEENSGVVDNFEAEFYDKNRKKIWVRFSAQAFPELGYLEGVGQGIDEERKTKLALEESERKFRALADSTSAAIRIFRGDKDLYANRAALELTGYTLEELTTLNWEKLVHPDDLHEFRGLKEQFDMGQGLPKRFEHRMINARGETLWVETSITSFEANGEEAWIITNFDITERKRNEEKLNFQALLLGQIQDKVIATDLTGKITYINAAFTEEYGFDPADVIGKNMSDFNEHGHHHECGPSDEEIMEMTLREGQWRGLISARSECGDLKTTECSTWLVRNEGEKPSGLVCVITDITERKKAEDALRESEQRFRALAESTAAAIFIAKDEKIVYANKTAMEGTGYSWDQLKTMSPADLLTPEEREKGLERRQVKMEEIQRGEYQPSRSELEVVHADGTRAWMESTIGLIELEDSPAFVITSFDITERKRAEEAIRQSEDRYRAIFETTGTATIIFGNDSIINLANEEFSKISGFHRSEIEGKKSWAEFFSKKSLKKMKDYHKRRGEGDSSVPRTYEAQLVDQSGKAHEGIVTISVVPGSKTRVASFLDLTDLKHAEQQMYRSDKMAALGQIIAGIAHEINNPNNFIFFNLPILKRYIEAMRPMLDHHLEEKPDLKILNMPYEAFLEDVFKLVENMQHGSERITGIVAELKNYIRSHEVEEKKPDSLAHVIEHVMTLVGKQVQKTVKHFKVDVGPGLPRVMMNAGKIEQVLINLIINAGHAADKEESRVDLSARLYEDDREMVEIMVEDNGSGIAEELMGQIFDPFFTTKSRESGTGLGLAISQKIIEEHEGRISVESEVGAWTRFTILLPVHNEEQA